MELLGMFAKPTKFVKNFDFAQADIFEAENLIEHLKSLSDETRLSVICYILDYKNPSENLEIARFIFGHFVKEFITIKKENDKFLERHRNKKK